MTKQRLLSAGGCLDRMGMKTSCILFVKNSVDSDIYRTKTSFNIHGCCCCIEVTYVLGAIG